MFYSRFAIGFVVCGALIAAAGTWAKKANDGIDQLQVANKTRALIVESIAELSTVTAGKKQVRRFKVTVKNGYSQPVVAYAFDQKDKTVGEGTTGGTETNGAVIGWTLAPNATHASEFYSSSDGTVVLTLAAVLLKDGSGDGDSETVIRLKEVRAGVKLGFQQIIPLLRRASASTENPKSETVLQSLEEEIRATLDENRVDVNLRRGFLNARDFILGDLRDLRARSGQHLEYPVEISKIKARVEDVLKDL